MRAAGSCAPHRDARLGARVREADRSVDAAAQSIPEGPLSCVAAERRARAGGHSARRRCGQVMIAIRKPSAVRVGNSRISRRVGRSPRCACRDWQTTNGRARSSLLERGELPAFLCAAVQARFNILVSGATGSGRRR